MKSLTIALPDTAFVHGNSLANKEGVDFSNYCSALLVERIFESDDMPKIDSASFESSADLSDSSQTAIEFNVAEHFKGFPQGSIEFAQRFIGEVLTLCPPTGRQVIRPFKKDRGIGFDPNFVFIEYLLSRGGKAGITVSFYGGKSRHGNSPDILIDGIPSYSRARIRSIEDLELILPHIRKAYELKYGKIKSG